MFVTKGRTNNDYLKNFEKMLTWGLGSAIMCINIKNQ